VVVYKRSEIYRDVTEKKEGIWKFGTMKTTLEGDGEGKKGS